MRQSVRAILASVAVVGFAAAVFLIWPASDPLAGVDAVILRSTGTTITVAEQELRILLSERNIDVVPIAAQADATIEVTDVHLNRIEALNPQSTNEAEAADTTVVSAVCLVTHLRTGKVSRMDFTLRLDGERVEAKLVPRRSWLSF
ncbi:hypothetical protein JW848_10695 [Candidatus Bipolaricaulota bacterium]|nr:hypothetical protein [Candidatus Bipolaricaulota bacterium]